MGVAGSETRFGLELDDGHEEGKKFAKPGREYRAINYRDRLGRFAKGIRKYPVTWATSVRETGGMGSRYIADVLKVFRGPVELDKFVASRPRPWIYRS